MYGEFDDFNMGQPMGVQPGFDDTFGVYPDGAYQQYGEFNQPVYKGPKDNFFFTMDEQLLLKLGFFDYELEILQNAVDYYGVVSNQKLSTPPFLVDSQVTVARIMYAYNICMGKKVINTDDPKSLAQHFKKLNSISGGQQTFSAFYVKYRNFEKVPRVAVVAGLPEGSFYVLNSKLYDKMDATYKVEKIAQEWVTILSERKMAVTYKDRLNNSYENREWGIPDILKVEEIGSFAEDKPWRLKIHKSRCRLCNRFLIVVTTKKMVEGVTEHHGGYCLVTGEGQIVYVYARTTDFDSYGNPKDSIPATTKDTAIVDYGFYGVEVESKLQKAVAEVAKKWPIVYSMRLSGETQFKEVPQYSGMELIRGVNPVETQEEYEDDEII